MAERVKWHKWGKEVFEKARKENKPILLDIYGSWCYWCHRMDEDTYENEEVASFINKNFIPIKVDTDKRPDINERYNQGGWPTTAFLTPDGRLITGATYLSPQNMLLVMKQVLDFFEKMPDEKKTIDIHKFEKQKYSLDGKIPDEMMEHLLEHFDTQHGGFYQAPKFPMPDAIELLFLMYRKTKDKKYLKMAILTLKGMLGIFDEVEGGFFRYSVTEDWSLPHYEKMLETNAELLRNYIHAFALTTNEKLKNTAIAIIEYIKENLLGNAFYGSQDANEEYYMLPKRERKEKPKVDRTVYTNWNAKAIIAFADASILNRENQKIAEQVMNFILENCYDKRKGMCHHYNGNKGIFGLLTDNIWTVLALLRLYELTGRSGYLEKAEKIAAFIIGHFGSPGFYDRIESEDDIGFLKARGKNIQENSAAAIAFTLLGLFTDKKKYRKIAEDCLSIFGKDYRNYGTHASLYAIAVELFHNPIHIIAVGQKNIEKIKKYYDPRLVLQMLDDERDKDIIKKKGYKKGFFICTKNRCDFAESADDVIKMISAY